MGIEQYKGINLISPKKFSDLVFWYDASQITGLSDGDPVALWPDLSGNGYDLVQATADKQPLYKTPSPLNGLPYVYFDGVNDSLYTGDVGSVYSAPNSFFMVHKLRDASGNNTYIDGIGGANRLVFAYSEGTASGFAYFGNYTGLTYTLPDLENYNINTVILPSNTITYRVGRALAFSGGAAVNQDIKGITMGRYYIESYHAKIDVAEFILYNRELSTYEIYKIEDYLTKKWGIKSHSNIATDNFTRGDSATSMGNCNSNQTWVAGSYQDANNPTIGISSNMGYFSNTPGTDSHAYIETGKSDCVISAKITTDSGSDSDKGIIFRRVDGDNYFFLHLDTAVDQLKLSRCLAGVRSDIGSTAGPAATLNNNLYIRVFLSGSSIQCGLSVNGKFNLGRHIETTDTNLTTATKHGLYNHSGNQGAFNYFEIDDFPIT
jgi:hypothetical protein